MSLVTLSGVAKSHGAQHLFSGVDLQISAGRRIAIVGPNGAGKTTLLEIITGDQEADAGTVTRAKDLVIGYLRQEVAEARNRPAIEEVLTGAGAVSGIERRMRHIEMELSDASDEDELAELMDEYGRLQHRFEAMGGYGLEAEARRILAGLGFAESDMERSTAEFSGGWMMRVALARLLLQNPDLLLLDEPSNHLDLASVEWLQGFLAEYAGAVLLVSHDRDFLDRVVTSVIASEGAGRWIEYAGGYTDMVAQRRAGGAGDGAAKSAAKPQKPKPTAQPAAQRKLSFKQKHAHETLPARIEALEAEIARLQTILADPGLYARDPAAFERAAAALDAVTADLAAAEEEWLALELLQDELNGR